jgi:hypothetical protein
MRFPFSKSAAVNHYHLRRGKHGWELTREGSRRAFASYFNRDDAVTRAGEIVRLRSGVLHIHRADGTVEDKKIFDGKEPL